MLRDPQEERERETGALGNLQGSRTCRMQTVPRKPLSQSLLIYTEESNGQALAPSRHSSDASRDPNNASVESQHRPIAQTRHHNPRQDSTLDCPSHHHGWHCPDRPYALRYLLIVIFLYPRQPHMSRQHARHPTLERPGTDGERSRCYHPSTSSLLPSRRPARRETSTRLSGA